MNREVTLSTASALVTGDRDREHGDATSSFHRIAALWSILLNTDVDAHQVAMCMAALKLSRLVTKPDSEDNWVDLAGYAALGSELATYKGEANADEGR